MAKVTWKPGTLEYPLPPVMVSCGTMEKSNIITVAWTGIISSEPAMTYVSIRPSRYSNELIRENMEFVINLTNLPIVSATDFCGVKSGKDVDKFAEMGLTKGKCTKVSAPQIVESPISLECKVVDIQNYGTHDMFVAEIVAVNIDDQYIDKNGKLTIEKSGLIAYAHNNYFTLGRNVGFFGFSVCKSDKMAKEKMKNVVVEIKEPKIVKAESTEKFAKKDWGRKDKPAGRTKKFDGKSKFEKSRDDDGEKRSFDRKPREDGERRSFGGGRGRDDNRGERKPFDRKPREDGEKRPYNRKPREEGERDERRGFGGGRGGSGGERRGGFGGGRGRDDDRGERKSFDRKPREDGDRSERKPFDRKPREGGERGGERGGSRGGFGGGRGGAGGGRGGSSGGRGGSGGTRGGAGGGRGGNKSFDDRPRKSFK